jgi:RNA polymerase sigma-70 factor (ECF subfamily)
LELGEVSAPELERASDRDLVAAVAEGSIEALRELSSRYGRILTALAMRFLGSEPDAEEVASDVLWQVWREARLFDANRGSVMAWLVMLGRSRSIDRLRAIKARSVSTEPQMPSCPVADPVSEVDRAERARIVRAALMNIDTQERTVLELAYFSDLSHSEIAEKLGIPIGSVKTRIRSAMMKLRKALSRTEK